MLQLEDSHLHDRHVVLTRGRCRVRLRGCVGGGDGRLLVQFPTPGQTRGGFPPQLVVTVVVLVPWGDGAAVWPRHLFTLHYFRLGKEQ